jgi:hypothetical protein
MIDFIGQPCTTIEAFTSMLARALDLPELTRASGETDREWLIRRVDPLKWTSRNWKETDLSKLDDQELNLAASQICDACADYCQDKIAERWNRERFGPEAGAGQPRRR